MFVCNCKINGKLLFKIVFVILLLLIFAMTIVGISKIFNREKTVPNCNEKIPNQINVISSSNYTNVLKAVHSDLNTYVGKKIKFTGFVYRLYDFSDDEFVLARQMIVSTDMQGVVVGFLCHLNGANKYSDNTWIEITGIIQKGNYHGEIPIIEIEEIKEVKIPSEEYVYPPDESYVMTSEIL